LTAVWCGRSIRSFMYCVCWAMRSSRVRYDEPRLLHRRLDGDCHHARLAERASTPAIGIQRNEVGADIDVDVAHVGIGHGAAGLVVGDQPSHHLALAAAGLEIDRLATGMFGDASRSRDARAGPAGRNDLHGAELPLDARQQLAHGWL